MGIWDLTPDFLWFLARAIVLSFAIVGTLALGKFFAWAMEWIFNKIRGISG